MAVRGRMMRQQQRPGAARFVMDDMVEDVLERLAFIRAEPRRALVIGMLANKDAEGVLRALVPGVAEIVVVPVPGHDHHPPGVLARLARSLGASATVAADLPHALATLAPSPATVLIAGSLYLAGEALAANDELPL